MLAKFKDYDKKIFRLMFLLNKLDTVRRVQTSEMAAEFNVTPRTVQRDIELLSMTGFPLVSSNKGTHEFAEGFSLKKLMLSKEEASLLSFMYEIAASLGDKFKESFRNIYEKLMSCSEESVYYVKVPQGIKLSSRYKFLGGLEKAIKSRQKVLVNYEEASGNTRCELDPLKIAFFDGFWYLIGKTGKKEQGGLVKLRLDHIKEALLSNEFFQPTVGIKEFLDQSVNIWASPLRKKRVVLKFSPYAARYLDAKIFFPEQRLIKTLKDGSALVESKVSHQMEILPTMFAWLPNILVISPRDLKAVAKEHLKQGLSLIK